MTYEEFCDAGRKKIDAMLKEIIVSLDCPDDLKDAMRYTLLAPGKRVRPLLALIAADACGADWQSALPVGCAAEMIHAFSLIHDDLPALDNDDERRGQPSSHKTFGEAQAILAGDALLALPFAVLADRITDPAIAAQCCSVLSKAAGPEGMTGGQWDDIRRGVRLDEPSLTSLHERKTGELIQVSLLMGGIVAHATPNQLDALKQYGASIGLAFQITDDVLDDNKNEQSSFIALFGESESKKRASALIAQAIDSVSLFADNSSFLAAFARTVIDRTS